MFPLNPSKLTGKLWSPLLLASALAWPFSSQAQAQAPAPAPTQPQPVTVTVDASAGSADISPDFLGLSYESSMLLPANGHYYFDANNQALVNTFKTLGIKSLRVGANAVDDPRIPIPQTQDIDSLFNFARAAGVKVIYSFRLKNGDPADSARLASYIAAHDADALDCFSIGNEPNFYLKTFAVFYPQWKAHYDAILKAVPNAKFDGPSADPDYAREFAKASFPDGHLAMVSDHYYFLGSGRLGEKDPPATRDRFLSNRLHGGYARDYAGVGAVLAAQGVPYRIDEMNSCYNGGSKDSSDTFASTLWALDCTHWWAAHHILGVNYHTGESVGRDGKFGPPNYAGFLRTPDGQGFNMRPQAYAYLAFSETAHGRPLAVKSHSVPGFDFNAYAYQDHDGSTYVTLINKTYDTKAQAATVSLQLPQPASAGTWQRMDLVQKDNDVAAKTDVTLGGAAVNTQGLWSGQWQKIEGADSSQLTVQVPATSAVLLHFVP
jgi:hypothetical protein